MHGETNSEGQIVHVSVALLGCSDIENQEVIKIVLFFERQFVCIFLFSWRNIDVNLWWLGWDGGMEGWRKNEESEPVEICFSICRGLAA
jgi:hypothetical protein